MCLLPTASADSVSFEFTDRVVFAEPDFPAVTDAASPDAPAGMTLAQVNGDEVPNVESVVLPSSLTTIGTEAFSGCPGMTRVVIPVSVTEIQSGAFHGCTGLVTVRYAGTAAQWDAINIGADNAPLFGASIYFSDDRYRIPINERVFPDDSFRAFVSDAYDKDEKGYLSDEELDAVTAINCSGTADNPGSISNLRGIERFRNLRDLRCAYNRLTSLDLPGNPLLEILDCRNNGLNTLVLGNKTYLREVYAHYNNLKTLDLSGTPSLTGLYIAFNQLESLNLQSNTKLTGLEVLHNNLSSLDLSHNTQLKLLYCGTNKLTALSVIKNPLLEVLDCHGNLLTSINVQQNPALKRLDVRNNRISLLNISNNNLLERLNCAQNLLTEVDIGSCPALVWAVKNLPSTVQNNIVYYYSGDEYYLVYDKGVNIYADTSYILINAANFPDPVFRSGVSEFYDKNKDGKLSSNEIARVTLIDCNNLGITTLKGIEFFTALKTLRCYGNPLTYLDISTLTKLEEFVCYNTRISTVDLRNNIYLRWLVNNTTPYRENGCYIFVYSPYKVIISIGMHLVV
jgi:Leucine-rich repeat (LRR) protein